MHEDLVRLDRLDGIDRAIASRKTEIEALATRLRDAHAAAEAASNDQDAKTADVEANTTAQRENTKKTREFQQRRASGVRILEMGSGDPDAAERQIAKCDELIDDAETEMLELLEQADDAQAALTAAQAAKGDADAALATAQTDVPQRTKVLEAEIEDLVAQRAPVLGELPHDIASRYEHFRSRNKWAVSRIERNACKACRIEVRPQHLSDLRKGRLEPCRGCHRWLVPDMQPA